MSFRCRQCILWPADLFIIMGNTLLVAENLGKNYGSAKLFENIDFSISEGDRIALIAKNGEGKSTFMKILAGQEDSSTGTVLIPKEVSYVYIPQDSKYDPESTILDCVLNAENDATRAIKAFHKAMENPDSDFTLFQQANDLMDKYDAWNYEQRVTGILSKLGLSDSSMKVKELSGGQRKRIALAAGLILKPDLMLLDEPTNHLDIEMTEWLEGYLNTHTKAILLVTHDRHFLNATCNRIIELENQTLNNYSGNYNDYVTDKAARIEAIEKDIAKSKNLFKTELSWMRRQPKARTTKSKAREDRFHLLQNKLHTTKIEKREMNINLGSARMGGKVVDIKKVSKAFGDKVILDDFSYSFEKGQIIGLSGPNGIGKTTLLEIITGRLAPDSGEVDPGATVKIGYYRQQDVKLPEDRRAIEVITDIAEYLVIDKNTTMPAGQLMQQFGFSPQKQFNYVSVLSGGEKRRLYLLTILMKQPNFLILDEPTNDLDIFTINVLEEFLMNFPGCAIVVSHDRFFMNKITDHILVMEGQGKVAEFNGTYSEYRELVELRESAPKTTEDTPREKPQRAEPEKTATAVGKKRSFKEQKEFDDLEAEIANFEAEIETLESKLYENTGTPEELTAWSEQLSIVKKNLERAMDRWIELSE